MNFLLIGQVDGKKNRVQLNRM